MITLLVLVFLFLATLYLSRQGYEYYNASLAAQELDNLLETGKHIPLFSNEDLEYWYDEVYMMRVPVKSNKETVSERESYNNSPQNYISASLKPEESYAFPHPYWTNSPHPSTGIKTPQSLYSRMYHWSPGFYSGTGWQFYVRPGISFQNFPRGRWIRNNGSYYFLNNYGKHAPDKRSTHRPEDGYNSSLA